LDASPGFIATTPRPTDHAFRVSIHQRAAGGACRWVFSDALLTLRPAALHLRYRYSRRMTCRERKEPPMYAFIVAAVLAVTLSSGGGSTTGAAIGAGAAGGSGAAQMSAQASGAGGGGMGAQSAGAGGGGTGAQSSGAGVDGTRLYK
jgi:hypothetical protein